MRSRLILLLLLSCAAFPAAAVVRRCVAADGTLIFTDRRCADVGAVERPRQDTAVTAAPVYRDACPRTLRDLVDRLRAATDVHDVNQLAALYQWNGQSTRTAYDVMNRLQKIVDRPLLDIGPVYAGGGDADDASVPTHHPLAGLRLEQTLADGTTPARTVLGVRRSTGCWWVSL